MAFLVLCYDKEDHLEKRLNSRSEHLDYLRKINKKLLLAGPILDDNNNPKGSVLVLDFKEIEELKSFLKHDPYSKVDLFKEIKILNFKKVL